MINETAEWAESIYLIKPTDPVEGGENGVDNRPHIELAKRTAWLKQKQEEQDSKMQGIGEKINELSSQVENIGIFIQNNSTIEHTNNDNDLQSQIDTLKEQIAQILANGGNQNGGNTNTGGAKVPVAAFDITLSTHYSDSDNPTAWGMDVSAITTFGDFNPVVNGDRVLGAYRGATVSIPDWVSDGSQVAMVFIGKKVDDAEKYVRLDISNHSIIISQARRGVTGSSQTLHPAGRVVVTFYK
ncbi:MAG: hypothetical protein Q4G13_00295 [Moraxella sp.]|nr:hypothetical protein [Moraxella sp.]